MFALVIIVKKEISNNNGSEYLFSSQLNIEFVNASFKKFCIVLLKLSAASWLWGWYLPPSTCLIPLFSSHEDNVLFTNSFQLSVWSIEGSPIMNTCAIWYLIVSAFLSLIGYAKPYLLNWSTIVKRYGYLLSSVILESSSTVSAWYLSYYEFDFIYLIILDLFLNNWSTWHDSPALQNSTHSSYIFYQNTFRVFLK